MNSWFYLKNGKVTGPVKLEDIQKLIESKRIGGFDLVYRSDEKKWKPVIEFSEMKEVFQGEEDLVNPDDEVTGSYDISQLVIPRKKQKQTQWVVLKILDRKARPVKTETLGPLDTDVVKKMIRQGDLSFQDYVWADGMTRWGLLVEQEELVPKVELPKLVESLTVEDTVTVPEDKGEDLFRAVEVTQPGSPPTLEVPPEDAGTADLVAESMVMGSKSPDQQGDRAGRTNEFKIVPLEEKEDIGAEPSRAGLIESKKSGNNKSNTKWAKGEKDCPTQSSDQERADRRWSFRLLQGFFGAFVIGGIVGVAFFLSHDPREEKGLDFAVESDVPTSTQVAEREEKQSSPRPIQKQPEPSSPVVRKKVEKRPVKPVKRAPSYLKLVLKGISGSQPKVEVRSDASHHYSADFLLTAAAGQILTHPSFHRAWTVKNFESRFKTIDFRSLGLGEGWYTLLVKVADKRALKTFFVGKKRVYNRQIRNYRKRLGYRHQAEKEHLFFVLKDLSDHLKSLNRAKGASAWGASMARVQGSLRAAQRAVSERLKNKNSHLWTVYWLQIRDSTHDLDVFLKRLKKGTSRGVRSQEAVFRRLLGKVQALKVIN